jgi:hypothetical protein
MTMSAYQKIVPDLLILVPEIRTEYAKMNAEFDNVFSEKEVNELQELERAYELSSHTDSIGETIVFENLLVPYVLRIASTGENLNKLLEIMNWIEALSNSTVFEVSNLVAGSFCEPLIASNEDKLPLLYPLMGKRTRELCKMQFSRFIVSDEIRKMFSS